MLVLKNTTVAALGRLSLAVSIAASPVLAFATGGGEVFPPSSKQKNYSLTDMVKALAQFQASFNNLQYYPATPFQILFLDPAKTQQIRVTCENGRKGIQVTGGNLFTVPAGTDFLAPLAYVDNSAPVLGTFPAQANAAVDYFFGTAQYGGRDFQIIVDGASTPIGAEFLAGPVQFAQPLVDGATAAIQLGAFLKQLNLGTHTITIRGEFAGAALFHTFKTDCIGFDFTYVVKVIQAE